MAGNNEDPTWLLFILMLLMIFGGWLTWHFFRIELMELIRYLRIVELAPLSLIDSEAAACLNWVRVAPQEGMMPSNEAVYAAAQCFGVESLRRMPVSEAIKYYTITPDSLGFVTHYIVGYLRWALVLFVGGVVWAAINYSHREDFRTVFTLESFIQKQASVWPVIAPIAKFNPSKHSARSPGEEVPDKLPLFAEALSPEEWVAFHGIKVKGGIPHKEQTRQAFLGQLGPKWSGSFDRMPVHILCLFAAFALKGAQKRDESDEFLGRLSTFWSEKKGFRPSSEIIKEAKGYLKDPEIGGEALREANKFAYRTTALLGVLRWARFMGGVLASAQFLWLRGTDRKLWYALNNLGRRSFHMEGAGALGHFMAEEAAGKPLPLPRLETAIVALNQYFAARQPTVPEKATKRFFG